MSHFKIRNSSFVALMPVCLTLASPAVRADKPIPAAPAPSSSRLAYQLKVGETHRYKLTAFFTGHFPPFAVVGSPPINLEADVEYVTTVKKVDDKGAQVEFAVDSGEIYLLEKVPGPGEVLKDDDKTEFPIPLSQIQKALNATAYLKENGSVVSVEGGDNSSIKVDLGIDLRKIFLAIMPVTFPEKSVQKDDSWTFDDGVLGHKPPFITYNAKLDKINPGDRKLSYEITETAQSIVATQLDKDGNTSDKPADVVGSLNGTVTAEGSMTFVTPTGGSTGVQKGRLVKGHMNMIALLKRTLPDPAHPDTKAISDIDVRARLIVEEDTTPVKPTVPEPPVAGVASSTDSK